MLRVSLTAAPTLPYPAIMGAVDKVLVVGAGPSGLAALKEMKEVGLDAMAVDSRSTIGGVFSPDSGVTFDRLHLTISSVFMSFSDFPAPDAEKGVKYWSQAEYYDYLKSYVEHFELKSKIQLNTKIERAHFDHERNQWQVQITRSGGASGQGGQVTTTEEIFDKLIVASGANHTPHLPESFKGFTGELLHSSDYHSAEQVRGKRVLVVGTGEGGLDVANSATKTAASVTVWGRRFPDCAPRFVDRFINDSNYDEHEYLDDYHKPNGVLEVLTTTRAVRNMPLGMWGVALHGFTSDMYKKHGPDSTQAMTYALGSRAWSADYFSGDTSLVPSKSSLLFTPIARRALDLVITRKSEFKGNSVSFSEASLFGAGGGASASEPTVLDNYQVDVDVVVACTGFRLDFDWISTSDPNYELNTNTRTWFKHCFPPKMGECLAFVGFARPHSGGIPQCAEMVSRYVAQIYSGTRKLPKRYAELALEDGAAERACFHQTPDYHVLVDYFAYMMSVAKLVGCTPRVLPPMNAPLDVVKYWTFPLWSCFFRTRGVGANPEAAAAVLKQFKTFDGVAPMPLVAIQILCGLLMPALNAASWVLDSIFPKLMRGALPKLYKWRVSKANFLYHNSLTVSDFKAVPMQWIAALIVTLHLMTRGLTSSKRAQADKDLQPSKT